MFTFAPVDSCQTYITCKDKHKQEKNIVYPEIFFAIHNFRPDRFSRQPCREIMLLLKYV
jgi:hypothetical protein